METVHSVSMIVCMIALVVWVGTSPYDETDDKANHKRSDLRLYTDYGTGCQYVRASFFGPAVPRVGPDGKPICTKLK